MTRRTILFADHVSVLSGGELSLVELARAVDRDRFVPALAAPQPGPLPEAFRALSLPVHDWSLPQGLARTSRETVAANPLITLARLPGLVAAARRLARVASAAGARVLHTNSQKAHVAGAIAARIARLPLVWHVRDILPASPVFRLVGLLGRSAARVIVVSGAVRHALVAGLGLPADRVVVVENGVAGPAAAPAPTLRGALGLPRDAVLAGYVGQIARWKGLHVLLEAAARLPGLHVAIAGDVVFPENEEPYSRELDATIARTGLIARVHRLGRRTDVWDVLASLDLLVLPSIEPEPFGRVLVEAMHAGVPIVASAVGATPQIVAPECGVLVPPGDPARLAGAIARLASDPAARAALGAGGRERARVRFTLASLARGVQAVWDEVSGR